MAIAITTNDGLSGVNSSGSFILPDYINDATKWTASLKSGKITEYKLSDPDALGHPGKLRIESRTLPNIYTLLPVNRSMQAPVREGQHIYMQSQKVITRTNTDTDTVQMYPYSVSIVVKVPTDPNVAEKAIQAAGKELVAFAHQLFGPYNDYDGSYEPTMTHLTEMIVGQTEVIDTHENVFPE